MTTGTNLFESLKADLKKLLQEKTMSVLFTKKDGTQRAMLCTLMSEHLPLVDKQEGDEVKKERKESDTSIRVWDLEKKDWRSFRIDSVVSYSPMSL
jgi:hypothetical protein